MVSALGLGPIPLPLRRPGRSWAPIWSAGVLLFSLRLLSCGRHLRSLKRRTACTDDAVLATVARLASRLGITRQVRVLVSSISDGPGVIGWLRPMLLLPPAAAMGLTAGQLEAVLVHELAHIRRHDYAVNVVQLVVETVFFYHPAVWWMSRQIRIERELCCDDVVVATSGDPVSYARALTTLAHLQLANPSPVPAPAMAAAGGVLLQRVEHLVGGSSARRRQGVPGLAMLALASALAALNADWLYARAQGQDQGPRFEVASVKVNRLDDRRVLLNAQGGLFRATGVTAELLIRVAYRVQEFQMVGVPDWATTQRFDIVAREPEGQTQSAARDLMLRNLLADRFDLAVHKETRDRPVYTVVLARADGRLGPQLRPSISDCTPQPPGTRRGGGPSPALGGPGQRPVCGASVSPGLILAGGRTLTELADALSTLTNTGSSLNRLVVDRTGLKGRFDAELRFTPEQIPNGPDGAPVVGASGPSIFTAMQEQLGLKLDAQRGPVEVLVIDRVTMPTVD